MSRHRSSLSTSSFLASPSHERSVIHSSGIISELFESRNNELSHRDALEQAKAEHDRVRERALRVFEMHELEVERQRIVKEQNEEEDRLKREATLLAEKQRLEALKVAKAPSPPPLPKPEPAKAAPKPEEIKAPEPVKPAAEYEKKEVPQPRSAELAATKPATLPSMIAIAPEEKKGAFGFGGALQALPVATPGFGKPAFGSSAAPAGTPPTTASAKPASNLFDAPSTTSASLFSAKPKATTTTIVSPFATKPAAAPIKPAEAAVDAVVEADPTYFPHNNKYLEIHQNLKKLRKTIENATSQPGSPLKGKVGEMRREIRKSMGQLTEGAGANKIQLNKIRSTLKASLDGTYPSPMVDVEDYVVVVPTGNESDVHKGDQMPSLYIYLLNIFSKAVINQFINECGANPKAADPIGVIFSQIFSDSDYHWRGYTLADIMFAKLRIVCPVLFGIRGSERVAAGRLAIGWKKDGPEFIPEQAHWDRMSGLGAGFGAITLRDFSKTKRVTPAPPTMYWRSLAVLVNTPVTQVSGTQLVVLKAIIDGHTTRFLQFYGNAAAQLLKIALHDFPAKISPSPGREALSAVADRLLKDEGLRFV